MQFDSGIFKFQKPALSRQDCAAFHDASMRLRSDILELIAAAGSGHLGGSYSTIDALLMAYLGGTMSAENADDPARDRVIVSHGHISPAVYTVLAAMGYIPRDALFREYRRVPGRYEGHPSTAARGVDWGSGSLGQGLSVGCGMALAAKAQGYASHTFVFMGDGENDKGQITEAMALAAKYKLGSLTAFVDYNGLQCSGDVDTVLPLHLPERYAAYGWKVLCINGHDPAALYDAFRTAYQSEDTPCVIIGRTVMGKGLPFIENNEKYHGSFLDAAQLAEARALLAPYRDLPFCAPEKPVLHTAQQSWPQSAGRRTYTEPEACRKAAGEALRDYAAGLPELQRPVAIDCDVAPSTGLAAFMKENPGRSVQCGIAEQNAVCVAGGMAASGVNAVFSTFASFALGEPYGQIRSCTMNHAPIKILTTHCGLDVGPDGKTHQCIDYIGLAANLFGFSLILPADANQTDRAVRYLAGSPEAGCVAVGRSVLPIVKKEDGTPLFGPEYTFTYGRADWVRTGADATIISYGTLLHAAVEAAAQLAQQGLRCGVLNISCPLALDETALRQAARGPMFVVEDHNVRTGLGSQIALFLAQNGIAAQLRCYGLERYGGSAKSAELYRLYGLDAAAIAGHITAFFEEGAQKK